MKQRLLSFIGSLVIRTLHATLRVRHINVENILSVPQYIIAFWHDHLLLMLHTKFRRPITVMSSHSRDGDIAVGIYAHYGVATSRGSSTRGGMAGLRGLIRSARSGSNIVFTPDGPRGPARVAKEGIIVAAQATGLPIVPIAFAAKKKKLLSSWDRMVVPLPFTQVVFAYGTPIVIPRDGDVEEWRGRVERAMNELADFAEQEVLR